MTLTVLQVAYPLAPVGADSVGGAEQILSSLDAGLVSAGCRSLVIACEGSKTHGILLATPRCEGRLDEESCRMAQERHRKAIERALERWEVDLVHMHGIDFHCYLPPPGPPVLATLHLPPSWYPPEVFHVRRPHTWLNCVSKSQQAACPASPRLLPEIENGVAVELLPAPHAKRRYTLCLGRICPEKGFHIALDAARDAHIPLLLAGEVFRYQAHEQYFEQQIVPRLDQTRRFLGPVGMQRKRRLLAAARCLLVPSLAPETSSLVAMEALACGTPVVAFPSGALGEIIEQGRTGFLVHDQKEMGEAIVACAQLDPEACRQSARRRFPLSRMVRQYMRLYQILASGEEDLCCLRKSLVCRYAS
jgi:glycosyltransferase involved in cell wall biosynthesis